MSEQHYSIPMVARLCAVTPRTIYRWIEAGRLPARRYGPRTLRVSATDLADFGRA